MGTKEISTKELKVGMVVEINPRSDRSRKKLVQGAISEILTKNIDHPHGILVILETGEIGRVKQIIGPNNVTKNDDRTSQLDNESHVHQLAKIIEEGENHNAEFKSSALWSSNYTNEDIKNHRPQSKELYAYGQATSKIIISKTIAGFLNSDGGTLIIGVKENKKGGVDEVVGIEPELQLLKDPCQDGYRRMIVDIIKDHFPFNIFNHLNKYFHVTFEELENLTVCGIIVSKSDKRVFLNLKGKDHFYIRTDASTRELAGEAIVEYCDSRFN